MQNLPVPAARWALEPGAGEPVTELPAGGARPSPPGVRTGLHAESG